MHRKNLGITAVVLYISTFLLAINTSYGEKISEAIGYTFGAILLPIFNAHLFVKYIDSKNVEKHSLLWMFIVAFLSSLFNSVLILILILLAIGLNKIRSKSLSKKS